MSTRTESSWQTRSVFSIFRSRQNSASHRLGSPPVRWVDFMKWSRHNGPSNGASAHASEVDSRQTLFYALCLSLWES